MTTFFIILGSIAVYLFLGSILCGIVSGLEKASDPDDAVTIIIVWPLFLAYFLGILIVSIGKRCFRQKIDEN